MPELDYMVHNFSYLKYFKYIYVFIYLYIYMPYILAIKDVGHIVQINKTYIK